MTTLLSMYLHNTSIKVPRKNTEHTKPIHVYNIVQSQRERPQAHSTIRRVTTV